MARRKLVVLGFLGSTLDAGTGPSRWNRWRPTVALCQHEDLVVDRLELFVNKRSAGLTHIIQADIASVSPETKVQTHAMELENPWALDQVYRALYDFAATYPFKPESEDYLIHITTGTHIAQIVTFLLTESRHFPAKLIQTSPARDGNKSRAGDYAIIDLDLSKYDAIAARFKTELREGLSFLKSGIETVNAAFNRLIERVEQVAIRGKDPILLLGPTGSGKSQLARRIFELKLARRQVSGALVEVNCATVRGDGAMSTLFGHVKGAFTGAQSERPGMLKRADGGVLFLDEIGELGLDEQAMLLRALEQKTFFPLGSDAEASSEFQLLAGTNRDLAQDVTAGRFREDLLARINLWTFRLPGLHERAEDIPPNLDFELERCGRALNVRLTLSKEAREKFLAFATSRAARWPGNFRDFNASIRRMATLCEGGRIAVPEVRDEVERLQLLWSTQPVAAEGNVLEAVLGVQRAADVDPFDRVQLSEVLRVCESAPTLSDAGRKLFAVSRTKKKSANDADRLRKYLARFDLDWAALKRRA